MGYKLLQTCIDCELPGLSDSEWRTLLVICRHADDVTGGNCHPSTQTICKKSRLTEKVVRKAIQSLEVQGWIRTSQNPGAVRFFEINVAKINDCSLLVGEKERPRAEVQGDVKERPRAEVSDAPVQKCTPSPCKSAPLREHIKEQEENISSSSISDPEPLTLTNDEKPAACTRKKAPAVPFAQIVEIYNAKLGNDLGICRKLSETRKSVLRQRWKDVGEIVESSDPKEILSGFGCYYDKIARSSFLMGRATNFKATFDWIHKSENFIKTYEGNYENGRYRN